MSDCFVLYLLLTCMKKKTSGADKFTNNNSNLPKLATGLQLFNKEINGIGALKFDTASLTSFVVGFDKEDVFKKMDAIANAVSDSCEPAIIPDITLQTVDGKTVIVVEVSEGRQRPYYIKALGRDGGVYVRVAGTTRLADEYMVKELLFEGSNRLL